MTVQVRLVARTSALTAALLVSASAAEDYPARPIRLIVPHGAGGSNDILARALIPRLTEILGQPIVVDNRGGAGGIIGTGLVAKAAADGYTLLLADAPHGANPALYSKMPYDTLRDFASISLVALMPSLLIVHPSVPAASTADLIALAKARPGQLNCGSAGIGSSIYLTMVLLINRTGINISHVPYKSGAPALIDLIAGQTQMQFVNLPPALQHVKAGRVKALGVTSLQRAASLPEVPPIAETGVPGFEDQQWQGVLGPAHLPRVIVNKLNGALVNVMTQQEVRSKLTGMGAEVLASNPERLAEFVKIQVERWSQVITPAMRIE
jgi:tripartite-type tricarboxylate transporter receptor subunit TctC